MATTACPTCGTTITDESQDECQFCRRPLPSFNSNRKSFSISRQDERRDRAENPFQAPESDIAAPDFVSNGEEIRVDGKYLVVRSGAVLPLFCVKTNQPIEPSQMKTKSLAWSSPYLGLLVLVHFLLYVIVYYATRQICLISFGLSPEYSRKIRNRLLLKSGFLIGTIAFLIAAIESNSSELMLVASLLIVISMVVLLLGNSVLRVKKCVNGQFWIAGCSPEFLSRINAS